MGKTFSVAAIALLASLVLSGCAAEVVSEPEAPAEQNEYLGATEDGSSIIVPLPSSEAREELRGILDKSLERFYTLGSTETFTNVDGEAEYTVIHYPAFELGSAYVVVVRDPDDPTKFIADWVSTFESFAVVQAGNLYLSIDPPAVFSVTKVDENRYILADEEIGSRTLYVSGGLIAGIDVVDGLGNLTGRTALRYGIADAEKGIVEQVYDSSSAEELAVIFPADDSR